MPMKYSACKSCRARIWWAVSIKGKSMPMDPDPSADAAWVIEGQTENGAPKIRQVDPLLDGAAPRFTPHWATCPNADQHRKR